MQRDYITQKQGSSRHQRRDLGLASFLLDCESRNLSPSAIKFYRTQIEWFYRWLPNVGDPDLDEITGDTIKAYFLYMKKERKLAPASQHAGGRALSAFFRFCYDEGWVPDNPMARIKLPKRPKKILPALSEQDVKRLLAVATTNRDRAILLCLLDTGCRASEFASWNIEDVNLESGAVRVMGKGAKERTVYLGAMARKALTRYYAEIFPQPPHAPVWQSTTVQGDRTGERLTAYGLNMLLRRLSRRAGVKASPHMFRRTFAVWCLRNGMNLYYLQKLMGHETLDMLKRYLDILDDDLADAHNNHGAVDGMLKP